MRFRVDAPGSPQCLKGTATSFVITIARARRARKNAASRYDWGFGSNLTRVLADKLGGVPILATTSSGVGDASHIHTARVSTPPAQVNYMWTRRYGYHPGNNSAGKISLSRAASPKVPGGSIESDGAVRERLEDVRGAIR